MSIIKNGVFEKSELAKKASGGTEQMGMRLVKNADQSLLKKSDIHLSKVDFSNCQKNKTQILWAHDLANDPDNKILENEGWKRFDHFVFVSYWQRDHYVTLYGIPYSKCTVIQNAIELEYSPPQKDTKEIRFIYHTTPNRGLELVYPIFDALSKEFDNIHLDIYSSFSIYGWNQRDIPYEDLFNKIKNHSHMTYHGAVDNKEILDALQKSHIFLFPSIWKETSCLAMIEAIRSGVLVIHPSYGALPETSANATMMYEYTEDVNKHANLAYATARNMLEAHKLEENIFNKIMNSERCVLPKNSINTFTNSWNYLLERLNNNNG